MDILHILHRIKFGIEKFSGLIYDNYVHEFQIRKFDFVTLLAYKNMRPKAIKTAVCQVCMMIIS